MKCPRCGGDGKSFVRANYDGPVFEFCRPCCGTGNIHSNKKLCDRCGGSGKDSRKFRGDMKERVITCAKCDGYGLLQNVELFSGSGPCQYDGMLAK